MQPQIIIIQCAKRKGKDKDKKKGAPRFIDDQGNTVLFVADSSNAQRETAEKCAHPDEVSPNGETWRKRLDAYNTQFKTSGKNPFGLLAASELYFEKIYSALSAKYGSDNVYILSAGWGLVRSDYLLPHYDVTFSEKASSLSRRVNIGDWKDHNHLLRDGRDGVRTDVLVGLRYLDLFYALTSHVIDKSEVVVHYKSGQTPKRPGYSYRHFEGAKSTTWYYSPANDLLTDGN